MNTLLILRGIPGSGKSTLAETLKRTSQAVVCSVDEYFMGPNGNYVFNYLDNHKAYSACQAKAKAAMEQGSALIVIDHTHTMEWEMEPFFQLAQQFDYRVHVCTMENRHEGVSIHEIPEEQIAKMKAKYKLVL
ncbi:MAG: ATP-binding protein [Flavobacteriales bacterium]